MTSTTNWIQREIQLPAHRTRFKNGKGFDVDGNGTLERKERFATYGITAANFTSVDSWKKWLSFYKKNAQGLTRLGGVFAWAGKFKSGNRLHIVTTIESAILNRADTKDIYKATWNALRLKGIKALNTKITDKASATSNFGIVFKELQRKGMLRKVRERLIGYDIKHPVLGYTALTYLLLAIADEKGWRHVQAAKVPHKIFVQWKKGRSKINADRGNFFTDAHYIKKHNLTDAFRRAKQARRKRPYLRGLNKDEFAAIVFRMAGEELLYKGNVKQGIAFLKKAVELDKTFVRAHNILGVALNYQQEYSDAIKYLSRAIVLNPHYALAYYNRGRSYLALKNYAKAISDLKRALKYRPKAVNWATKLAMAYIGNRNYVEAIKILKYVRTINPNSARAKKYLQKLSSKQPQPKPQPKQPRPKQSYNDAYYKRIKAKLKKAMRTSDLRTRLKLYESALKDYKKALKFDPNVSQRKSKIEADMRLIKMLIRALKKELSS